MLTSKVNVTNRIIVSFIGAQRFSWKNRNVRFLMGMTSPWTILDVCRSGHFLFKMFSYEIAFTIEKSGQCFLKSILASNENYLHSENEICCKRRKKLRISTLSAEEEIASPISSVTDNLPAYSTSHWVQTENLMAGHKRRRFIYVFCANASMITSEVFKL